MSYLILSILFNALLFVIIKSFAKFNVDTLQALVVNYFTAFFVGYLFLEKPSIHQVTESSWLAGSLFLGCIFIGTFYATTITSQKNGLSVASVASKMSIVIPVVSGVLIFQEQLKAIKIIGIALALIAVYFTSKKEKGTVSNTSNLFFPILVFLGAGTIDASLNYLQTYFIPKEEVAFFSTVTFLVAFCIGSVIVIYQIIKENKKIAFKNVIAGILLGIPNYFSLYFLIKMLEAKAFQSATLFTIHNISIVVVTAIVGVLFFKEYFSKRNIFGILLALLALYLVTQ